MTRVNQPDSLLSELRDIKRRLRALETRGGGSTAQTVQAATSTPVPDSDDETPER